MTKQENATCDFCGHSTSKVGAMVEGVALVKRKSKTEVSHICQICANICQEVLAVNHKKKAKALFPTALPTPRQLLAHLDEYIIGQEHVKRQLSVAVVNHYKRLLVDDHDVDDPELKGTQIAKSNVLLLGPTGCGKTALAQALATRLKVPFAIGDATTVTEAGYVGEDVENLILKLVQAADFDIAMAEKGIIYIDEIDKIGKTGGNRSITRDVSGEGVQQALLKLLEGTMANIPPQGGRKHPEQQYLHVDTSNILFIVGGAFVGIEDIIAKRLGKSRIGFNNSTEDAEHRRNELLQEVIEDDLIEFGLIPELVGRLPIVGALRQLSTQDLERILVEPRNSLVKQYRTLFHIDKAKLKFTDGAIREIAKKAKAKKTGARALRSVMEALMLDIMFSLPDAALGATYIITEEVVRGEKSLFSEAA